MTMTFSDYSPCCASWLQPCCMAALAPDQIRNGQDQTDDNVADHDRQHRHLLIGKIDTGNRHCETRMTDAGGKCQHGAIVGVGTPEEMPDRNADECEQRKHDENAVADHPPNRPRYVEEDD